MKRLSAYVGALALLILAGPALADPIPGKGSCGPRDAIDEWMAEAGARTLGYSIMDVYNDAGQFLGQLELSFWLNREGETALVGVYEMDDPQHGRIAFGCVTDRGNGNQPTPIFVPKKGV